MYIAIRFYNMGDCAGMIQNASGNAKIIWSKKLMRINGPGCFPVSIEGISRISVPS